MHRSLQATRLAVPTQCPLLAFSGHATQPDECLLLGEYQTWRCLQNSGADAARERLPISSLPGLTRQSMLSHGLFNPSARSRSLHLSMDHRIIGERSDAVLPNGYARW